MRITPTVARGAQFNPLNPDLPTRPDYLADHAVATALSPGRRDPAGAHQRLQPEQRRRRPAACAAESNEYVFVYDVRGGHPVKKQVLQVPNTFAGLAWNPQRPRVLRRGRRRRQRPRLHQRGRAAGSPAARAVAAGPQQPGARAGRAAAWPAAWRSTRRARGCWSPTTRTTRSAWSTWRAREAGRAGPAPGQDRPRPGRRARRRVPVLGRSGRATTRPTSPACATARSWSWASRATQPAVTGRIQLAGPARTR